MKNPHHINLQYHPKPAVRIFFTEPTLTKQAQKDECDVNKILARYQQTGVADHINEHQQQYGDVSPLTFHESMNIVANANSMFEDLPSSVRKKFHNDPAQFLEFVQDPDNAEKLIDMGLATPTPTSSLSAPSDESKEIPPAPAAKTTETEKKSKAST